MALSDIIERINAQAEEEARAIIAEAERRAEQTRVDARNRAEAILKEARARALESAESHKRRLITLASLDLRKQVGDVRQKAVDTAFEKALEHIKVMSDEEYLPLLKALIVDAVETGEEEIVLSPADRARLDDEFLASVNQALAAAGKKGKLRLAAETRPVLGGVILIGDNVEINCTFDSTLKLIRDDIEPEVASLLFGDAFTK